MVNVKESTDELKPLDLLTLTRVAGQVGKQVLLATVAPNALIPSYINMNWWKGDKVICYYNL